MQDVMVLCLYDSDKKQGHMYFASQQEDNGDFRSVKFLGDLGMHRTTLAIEF